MRFSLAKFSPNFSQKFNQKLTSDPEGSFYSIFCEKIVVEKSFYTIRYRRFPFHAAINESRRAVPRWSVGMNITFG